MCLARSSSFYALLEFGVLQQVPQEDDTPHGEVQHQMSLVNDARIRPVSSVLFVFCCVLRTAMCCFSRFFQSPDSTSPMLRWSCKKGIITCHVNRDHTRLHIKAMLGIQARQLFMLTSPFRSSTGFVNHFSVS